MLITMWKRLLVIAISLSVVSAQLSLGNLNAGARHNYNNIHLISDLNGITKVVIQKELTTDTLVDIMYFTKLTGTDGTYTTTVPSGMSGCVDPVTSASVNAGGTINIPRAGSSSWANWGNTGGSRLTDNRATAAWPEANWIDIAYCDATTTLYSIEIKLVNQLANGNDGAETTRYFWHMEASFEDSSGNVLATEEVNSNCPATFYKDSVAGTYGRCSTCACPAGYTNLCDGTSTTTYSQSDDCQSCECQVGYAAVDSECISVASGAWPTECATDATHSNCGTTFCLPCTCDAPGMVFDKVDCPGTKTYNTWLVEKHEDVAGAKDASGADESGGHCRTCQCSTRGYYIDPAVCSSFSNQGNTYSGTAYDDDGDYQAWVDAHCYPCSCGDKNRAAGTASTFEGYYVSTEVGQCDGAWITHVRGQLKSASGELLSSITTQPGSGVADNTYTGLASSDDSTYASGGVFSITIASGSVTGITATSVGSNYVERDIITISKTVFGISSCDQSGGRETNQAVCTAAASTWNAAACDQSGGRETNQATCTAAAGTWADNACSDSTYTTQTACTTQGTWTAAHCTVSTYTTQAACTTQGTWSTTNEPANDIKITLAAGDIATGTATAPHGGVNPTAADGAGSGNNAHNTAVAGQIWAPLAQDGINVATFANNDGWCRECACYTGLATTSILGDVRGGASPVAGSYFTSSFCPSGKPQAAGGAGTRLDASSETASQTNGKGWLDYYADTSQTVGGPASQACKFADASNPATGVEWDCTLGAKKLHTYDAAGDGYFINSATGKCDGKTGYTDLAAAATACCTACSCSSGQYIDASSGICDGDTVHAVSSSSQPTNACVDCACAAGQYFDLSICDGNHPSTISGTQTTVGECSSGCNPGFQKGTSTATIFTDLTGPNDDDGRVCRDCSCLAGQYIGTASGKCDGSTGFDSKRFETGTAAVIEAARKAALNSHRSSVCLTCNCERGGTLVTTAGGLTASYTSGAKTSDTDALVATGVIVSEDNNLALSVTYNADSTDLSAVTVTTAGSTIHYIGGTLTTTNLVAKGGTAELVFTLVANDLTRSDRTAIVNEYSYINTGICNGFKINNAPDNSPTDACTACGCSTKSNLGVGWYIDQSLCEGTDTYDDTSVTATDTYCKQCHTKCSLGQYVNTDVCDGTNAKSVSNADGSQIVNGCKDCSCAAGNYIETRDSPYDFGSNTADKPETSTGSLTDTAFTTARTAGTAVDVSCDGKYQYSAALNSGNGHASACVDCSDLCTTAIQGTAKYVDSSSGKCDGATNGARSSTATSPATVLSVNMPSGGCGSCDCVAGQYIDMKYCNTNIVSTSQPSAATRCNECKCSSGQWLDYQNEDSNEANLYAARGEAAEGGSGAGAAGAGECVGTEIGTTDTGAQAYSVTKSGQTNFDSTTPTTKAGVAPNTPSGATVGPITPYYCITNTVPDHCATGDKLTATTSDGLLDTTCTKLKTGEQCPTSDLVDCVGKCGGTSLSCPNMYGYVTGYKDSADTCEHRCVKWRGDLRENFREYLLTDVSTTAICDLLRESSTLDLTSSCCSGAQSTWTTNCEAVP